MPATVSTASIYRLHTVQQAPPLQTILAQHLTPRENRSGPARAIQAGQNRVHQYQIVI